MKFPHFVQHLLIGMQIPDEFLANPSMQKHPSGQATIFERQGLFKFEQVFCQGNLQEVKISFGPSQIFAVNKIIYLI